MEFYTEDLADFGRKELFELGDILKKWESNGLPQDFEESGVKPAFNMNSGNVFLVNEDYQVAMINPSTDKLESFYSLSYSGEEGFADDLKELYDRGEVEDEEDVEQLRDLGIIK